MGWCALLGYLLSIVGFPVTVRAAKDRSQPFPCDTHACGCQNAEDCWRHCCCFSAAERLTWADKQHVPVPQYAERPVPRGWNEVRQRDRAAGKSDSKPCCAACAQQPKPAPAEVKEATPTCRSKRATEMASPRPCGRWLLGMNAQRCRGHGPPWMVAGAGVALPPRPTSQAYLQPVAWLDDRRQLLESLPPLPPDPPPRLLSHV
jgi:hypothetical protein